MAKRNIVTANKQIVVPKHVLDAYNNSKLPPKEHIRFNYMPDPVSPDKLADYILEEIQGFNENFELHIDEHGFVQGTATPADVVSLGYKLLAWALIGNRNLEIKQL